jgi:non-canonical purine NTP pyrophosphatase (RdgB/HAM1 family)
MQLYFVTSNEGKVKEVESILGFKVDKVPLDIKEIQTIEVEEVVEDKAKKAFSQFKKTVMVEDTGFYIQTWKGFPGALIKWVLKTLGREELCEALKNNNREVAVKTSVCLYNGNEVKIFNGEVKGIIPEKPRGGDGFGWDPIFQPEGHKKTFGEMTREEKNAISMRKIALEKAKDFLEANPYFLR